MSQRSRALALYRAILKAHITKLPLDLRHLGSSYVRKEFKLHKQVTQEPQLREFFSAWEGYLEVLQRQADVGKFGAHLDEKDRKLFNDDQKEKLVQLKEEVKEDLAGRKPMEPL